MKNKIFTISLIIIGLILLIFSYNVNADDTGWASPENFYYVYNQFNNAEEAMQQDDTYAISDLDSRADEQDWYECDLSSLTGLSGCPVIDGIIVEFDAYAGGSGQTYEIKLTWDSGSSWTSGKISSSLSTSDTDTYIAVGGSSDTWGRTWSKSEFIPDDFGIYFHHNAGNQPNYLDHIRVKVYYTYIQPDMPSYLFTILDTNPDCNNVTFHLTKGTGADYTLVKWSTQEYPTFIIGTEIYNGTGTQFTVNYTNWCDQYYVVAWSWNTTYCRYSQDYDFLFYTPCNWNINTIYNNTENITGTIETQYNCKFGWKIWINMSGNTTTCNSTDLTLNTNMTNVWHSNSTSYDSVTGWEVNVTAYSTVNLINNTVNATLVHEAKWNDFFARWDIWGNATGNDTGGSCDLQYLNYSDNNITINITYWGCNSTNTSNYNVNEDNWLYLAGTLLFDNAQIFLLILISFWLYFLNKYYELGLTIHSLMQVGVMIPLVISLAVISFEYPFGYIIIFIIGAFSIYVAYEGFMYGKK